MLVKKRNGKYQPVDFEKIHWRIKSMCAVPQILEFQKKERPQAYSVFQNLSPLHHANVDLITQKTIEGLYDNIPTTEIDALSAEVAQEMCTVHPDNSALGLRLLVSNLQKNVSEFLASLRGVSSDDIENLESKLFLWSMETMYQNLDQNGERSPLIAPYILALAMKYTDKINGMIHHIRDFTNYDYLGVKMLEKGYLFKVYSLPNMKEKNVLTETPSIADMRIALGLSMAPKPCPPVYDKNKVLFFLMTHPECIKEKYRNSYTTRQDLLTSDEPHKHKSVISLVFKQKYWEEELQLALRNLDQNPPTESQWNMVKNLYDGMSLGKFTPATPTRFFSGKLKPQCSSCFLIAMKEDSLKGIYDTLAEQAQISKHAGGVGLWVTNIRSTRSYIGGTSGHSNGLKPMLRVFNATASYVDQGGKRAGSAAIYLEPWHADIIDFVRLKRKKGADTDRARELFYALWIPDEFFRCWKNGKDWYLFDPSICPKLLDSYDEGFSSEYLSDEFVNQNKKDYLFTYRYRKYIRQNKYISKISSEHLMEEVVETVKESGVPYMLAKDAANRKSNQKNIGVIKSSNLCTEIIQYSDATHTSICNLASICLNKFVREWREGDSEAFKYQVSLIEGTTRYLTFDFEEFGKTSRMCQQYLDNLIDINFYPTEAGRNANMKMRNIGIGVQSESNVLAMLRLPWNSKEAHRLRFYIFERMYYECVKSSIEMAKEKGPYFYYEGSPASQGLLQFDLWLKEGKKISFPFSLPWEGLKSDMRKYALRNSLFTSPMPTASTSAIMGNSPCFEPFNSLIYVKKNGAGDVTMVIKSLIVDLMEVGLWSKEMSEKIIANHGSIQNITEIPKKLRDSYLTVYDMEPEDIIDAAYVRGWFVDQSQSMNLFVKNATMLTLSKAWTRAWNRGLKTLSYYVRSRPATTAMKAQISATSTTSHLSSTSSNPNKSKDKEKENKEDDAQFDGAVCSRDNPNCLSCGS